MNLRIGHRSIRLERMRPGEAHDQDARGLYLPNAGVIHVDPDQQPDVQAEVVLHEVIHALWETYGLPPRVDEEEVASVLAKGLAQVIRDNPALVTAVQAALEGIALFPRRGGR